MTIRAYKKIGRKPCSLEGCEQALYAKSLCVTHYSRLRRNGTPGEAARQRGIHGEGHINEYGYRIVRIVGHPLATAQGKVYEHRAVLFSKLGAGDQVCHWCTKSMPWKGGAAICVNVDHLDGDRLNNEPANLVASCLDCNTKRGVA